MTDRDIVERLHHHAGSQVPGKIDTYALLVEAADEIERLRAEDAKLRGICRTLVDSYVEWQGAYSIGDLYSARIAAQKALGDE